MTDNTPEWYALPKGGFISTVFTFQSKDVQNQANATYVHKSTVDASYVATNSNRKYNFKTDRERMLYIIGQRGTVPRASGY
jgi:hypothetical protein